MGQQERFIKRSFDVILAFWAILFLFPVIVIGFFVATWSTKSFGIYAPLRVGKNATLFKIYKLRTMKRVKNNYNTVTTLNDPRITPAGKWLRKFKIDELPQLWNVLIGDMSLVGPRPDVTGFADLLEGENKIILSIRPGITGLATLKFKHEEALLAKQKDPIAYNTEVIWPQKVQLNKTYVKNYSFALDLKILWQTLWLRNN